MDQVVKDAFKSGPGGQVIVEAFGLRITRRDLLTVTGTNWLNDEVINFYMNLIIERGKMITYPSVYCFNTFFCNKLKTHGYSSIKNWTRKIDVFSQEILIVPVHKINHWTMASVDLKYREIHYFDSIGKKNNKCLTNLLKYLEDEYREKHKLKFDTTGWILENLKNNPRQTNHSDCGVFSCMYAEYLCRRANITFSQNDMIYFRHQMAYEIITKKLIK